MTNAPMYQVSTLQALALGYTRGVITVGELKQHGDIGLGTFEVTEPAIDRISAPGLAGEFDFVTPPMTEDAFAEKAGRIDLINRIRIYE